MRYRVEVNLGGGWRFLALSDSYQSSRNIGMDYAIEHDCDYRVITLR